LATVIDLQAEILPHTTLGLMLVVEKGGEWKSLDFSAINIVDLVYFSEYLKTVNDSEEFFPAGKWATIQMLQQLIQKRK